MSTQQPRFPRVARFRSAEDLRTHLRALSAPIPLDDAILSAAAGSPLAEPIAIGNRSVGNRWCIHPMEGWDATLDGLPTDILLRRWKHFGTSGAKLIWGGEAVAVVPEGRANPNQLSAAACGPAGFATLLATLLDAHRERHGNADDLLVALQLTHSGRFSRPTAAGRRPRIAYHHPLLDARHGDDPADISCLLTDDEVETLIDRYVAAAQDAQAAGFDMVDLKACHGYLIHEFLSARRRPGRFGGDFLGRTLLLRTIIQRVREACPSLLIGVRLSLFDIVPWHKVGDHGEPWPYHDSLPYDCGFGVDRGEHSRIGFVAANERLDGVAVDERPGGHLPHQLGQRPQWGIIGADRLGETFETGDRGREFVNDGEFAGPQLAGPRPDAVDAEDGVGDRTKDRREPDQADPADRRPCVTFDKDRVGRGENVDGENGSRQHVRPEHEPPPRRR